MKKVTLVNPRTKPIFGAAYLDPWSGYDLTYVTFDQKNDQPIITAYDSDRRAYHSRGMTEQDQKEIYWQLIRRGWRPIDMSK